MPRLRSIARRTASLALRPVWRRAWARVESRIAPLDARLEDRLAPLDVGLAALDARLAPLDDRLAPLDAGLAALSAGLAELNARLASVDAGLATLDARLAPLEIGVAGLDARLAPLEFAWRQHVPSFLNAVGTVSAFAYELTQLRERSEQTARRLDTVAATTNTQQGRIEQAAIRLDNADATARSIWERIEFVRRETMFEMAHGDRGRAQSGDTPPTPARILAPDKVAAAQANGELRLNLGCGHIALDNWVNVDLRDLPGVDVVADVGDLPFERDSVDEIFSAHLLEHFPQEAVRRRLLPYWQKMLRPGGTFRAVTPDAAAMLAGAGAGTYPFEEFREVVFGAQDYDGDYHYNLFTPDSLSGLLKEAGFRDIEVPFTGRRNGKCFEFEISARRA